MLHLIPGWRLVLVLVLPLLLAVSVLTVVLALAPARTPAPSAQPFGARGPSAPLPLPTPAGLLVHVSGAVAHPGLYHLRRGDRVDVAIAAAGGMTGEADPQRIPNLAGRLRDGEQVRVPFLKGPGGNRSAGRVPLNGATAEELATLPGFTPELAAQVIDHRDTFGPFASLSELVSLLGMSRADYLQAKPRLTLN